MENCLSFGWDRVSNVHLDYYRGNSESLLDGCTDGDGRSVRSVPLQWDIFGTTAIGGPLIMDLETGQTNT